MSAQSLVIVLPAYNEEARLGAGLDELFAYLRSDAARAVLPPDVRVLVVDDGSSDGTAAIVRHRREAVPHAYGSPAHLTVLSIPHGGKGAAVRAGMLAADADILVFADADMAAPPDQLAPLVAALRDNDVALGSRIQPDGSDMRATQPRIRRIMGRVFHALAWFWVGPIQDTQCGFKGFRHSAAREVFVRQRIRSIVFDVEIIHLARLHGYRIAVVPIRWADRRGSRMHPRPRLALRVVWDLVRISLVHRGEARQGGAASPGGVDRDAVPGRGSDHDLPGPRS